MFTFRPLYEKVGYRNLALIHLGLVLVALGILLFFHQTTGEMFIRSIEFRGGVQMNIEGVDVVPARLQAQLEKGVEGVKVRSYSSLTSRGISIEAPPEVTESDLIGAVEGAGVDAGSYSFQTVGPTLGAGFFSQSVTALAMAFIFMGIVAFIMFHSVAPSLGIIQAIISNLLVTLAFMRLVGLELSLATFAALLLIIGYSVDTDILLTNRVLKREGEFIEKVTQATRTGLTMTTTAIAAIAVLYVTSTALVLKDIASTLLIALFTDIPATWFMNVGILRWWTVKKGMT